MTDSTGNGTGGYLDKIKGLVTESLKDKPTDKPTATEVFPKEITIACAHLIDVNNVPSERPLRLDDMRGRY